MGQKANEPPQQAQQGPAGALPGPWPDAPEAPIIVPLPGKVGKGCNLLTRGRFAFQVDGPCLYVGWDRLLLLTHLDGVPLHAHTYLESDGLPLAALWAVQAGTVHGPLPKASIVPEVGFGDPSIKGIPVQEGPAIWIRCGAFEWLLPNPDPQRLAAEIQRRRRRVAAHGGAMSKQTYETEPRLIPTRGAEGPVFPDLPPEIPAQPTIVPEGQFEPLPELELPAVDPPTDHPAPQPPTSGERASKIELVLPGSRPMIQKAARETTLDGVPITIERELYLWGALSHPVSLEEETPNVSTCGWHLASVVVVRPGTFHDVPEGAQLVYDGGNGVPFRISVADGPAVWLWGPDVELVLATPDAAQVAAEINKLRWELARDPGSVLNPNTLINKTTWRTHPWTAPVTTASGPAPAPAPPFAPRHPTVVPPECWTPTG